MGGAEWCEDQWIGNKDDDGLPMGLPSLKDRRVISSALSTCFNKCDDTEKKLLQKKMTDHKIKGHEGLVQSSFINAQFFAVPYTNQRIFMARRALRRIRRILDVCIDDEDEGKDVCGINNAKENERERQAEEKAKKLKREGLLGEKMAAMEGGGTEGAPAVKYD